MDKTIDRWTDPDGNGYAFKDTVARAQNRATIDKMNTETADRKSELDIERKRIDNLIQELPATAGEYQQSKLVLHSYDNTAVKCTTTSGNYTNVPAFTTDQGGPLSSLYTKKSNYQIAVNKSGLYLFELRIHVNSLIANKRVELAPFVNDTRIAALASSYNTAGSFTLTQVAALPLWLSANDTVDFRIAPIDAAEVSLQLGDVLVYAIDWEDKFKIPDYTGYAAETKDIRTGADGTVYGTAGEAVRKQIGNLTEDLDGFAYNYIKEKGYVAYETGNVHELGEVENTGFLPIKKGMIVKVKGIAFPSKDGRGLALYDTNKSFIEGYQYNENDVYKFEVKRDGYLNCTIVSDDITIIANQNGISNAMFYIMQDVNSTLNSKLNNIIIQNYSTAKQLEIVDTQKGYAVKNNGLKENAGWINSLKFLCEPYQKIFTDNANSHQNYPWIVLFDENNNVVGSTDLNESGGGEIIAPHNVAYGWMNCYQLISYANTQLYTEEINENILPEKLKRLTDESNPLSNLLENGGYTNIFKKISCIGDSLTEGVFEYTEGGEVKYAGKPQGLEPYSYPTQLARMTGATVNNYGVGGATAKSWLETTECSNCFKNENKAQAYIIALGTNDTDYSGNVDTDIDLKNYSNNADTFVGNYAKIIQKCLELQPKAKVFVVTIPKTRTDYHHAWTTGNSQIKSIAEKLGVYVLDVFTYSESHDNPDKYKEHFYTGGHRNAIGYKRTAVEYATYISWLIYNNPNDFKNTHFIEMDYEYTD